MEKKIYVDFQIHISVTTVIYFYWKKGVQSFKPFCNVSKNIKDY